MTRTSTLIACAFVASFATLRPASAAPTAGAIVLRGAGASAHGDVPGARDVLAPGRRVAASAEQPLELRMADGVTLTLEPGATGVLLEPGELPTESSGWTHGYHFQLVTGRIEFHVPDEPRGKRAFTVSTSAGTLTGWRGMVEVAAREDSVIAAAHAGALAVGSNGIGIRVYDGGGVAMRRGVNPVRTHGMPATPKWPDTVDLVLLSRDAPADLSVTWRPTDRAVAYGVEVAKDSQMLSVLHRATVGATHVGFGEQRAAAEATYFVRVRAIDADGLSSPWSDVRSRRLVRVEVPSGGSIAKDGTFVLPRAAAVTLASTSGLEVAYEREAGEAKRFGLPLRWLSAPRELRLDGADHRTVHLRDVASGNATTLALLARSLRARVTVGPPRATWPRDAIDVAVTIDDPTATIDPANERVTLSAAIGLDPIATDWTRDGNTYRTRIPPRFGGGPWVVRVSARDSTGLEIGSGFLEIVAGK